MGSIGSIGIAIVDMPRQVVKSIVETDRSSKSPREAAKQPSTVETSSISANNPREGYTEPIDPYQGNQCPSTSAIRVTSELVTDDPREEGIERLRGGRKSSSKVALLSPPHPPSNPLTTHGARHSNTGSSKKSQAGPTSQLADLKPRTQFTDRPQNPGTRSSPTPPKGQGKAWVAFWVEGSAVRWTSPWESLRGFEIFPRCMAILQHAR